MGAVRGAPDIAARLEGACSTGSWRGRIRNLGGGRRFCGDMRRVMLIAVAALVGCGVEGDDAAPDAGPDAADAGGWAGPVTIAPIDGWQPVEAEDDPFADRPDEVVCPEHGYGTEVTLFEVETEVCHYATFAQPTPVALRAGDVVRTTAWHLTLWAPEPAEAHVAFRLGDGPGWERHIPIPSAEAAYAIELVVDDDVPAGTPLYFHVHNHGVNSYRLLEVTATRP